tara:strand:+ start:4103 stop:4531 length:429 start_codon:yes stop_codon:yes gene_type:complete
MALGNMLRERDVQYTALKDEVTNTWRILDTWHEDLKSLSADDDIPDDSKAVIVITEGGFLAIIREAARLGVLENAAFSGAVDDSIYEEEIHELKEKIVKYEKEITKLQVVSNESESFKLKEKALGAVLKLAAMSDVALLSED